VEEISLWWSCYLCCDFSQQWALLGQPVICWWLDSHPEGWMGPGKVLYSGCLTYRQGNWKSRSTSWCRARANTHILWPEESTVSWLNFCSVLWLGIYSLVCVCVDTHNVGSLGTWHNELKTGRFGWVHFLISKLPFCQALLLIYTQIQWIMGQKSETIAPGSQFNSEHLCT
jgi:hypothetical protein